MLKSAPKVSRVRCRGFQLSHLAKVGGGSFMSVSMHVIMYQDVHVGTTMFVYRSRGMTKKNVCSGCSHSM